MLMGASQAAAWTLVILTMSIRRSERHSATLKGAGGKREGGMEGGARVYPGRTSPSAF